jgi:cystathionine gamma-synthase
MRDVRGYEEKDPATMRHLTSGYPRFVVHPFACRLAEHFVATRPELAGRTLWLTTSARMARALADHLAGATAGAVVFAVEGLDGVSHPDSPALWSRAKTFLQNLGGFLSSRAAESALVRLGLLAAATPETRFAGDAGAEIRRVLRHALPGAADADLVLAPSGMNAIYAAFQASAELQAARGRTVWLQLGWLYLDTIAILKKFTRSPADYVYLRDPLDREAIERIFAQHGSRIAGVMAELPTNPLIQTPDVAALSALCRQHGAHLLVDPSVASIFCVNVLPYADVVVASLTKYTASEGDLTAGLVAINPDRPDAAELRRRVAAGVEPVFPGDLSRLAAEIGETEAVDRHHQRQHRPGGRVSRRASKNQGRLLGAASGFRGQLSPHRAPARRHGRHDHVHVAERDGGVLRPAATAERAELRHEDDADLSVHVPGAL